MYLHNQQQIIVQASQYLLLAQNLFWSTATLVLQKGLQQIKREIFFLLISQMIRYGNTISMENFLFSWIKREEQMVCILMRKEILSVALMNMMNYGQSIQKRMLLF